MSEYTIAKGSKLKLKGEKNPPKKKKRKIAHPDSVDGTSAEELARQKADTDKHGGWWSVGCFEEITGAIAIEFGDRTYMKSWDDGTFALGAPHSEGDEPSPEEIFTAIRINDNRIAIKSGYGKYLKVEKDTGRVVGRSDAVSAPEHWEPIFDEGKLALLSFNGHFISAERDTDTIVATSKKAGPDEFIKIRCKAEKDSSKDDRPAEEKGNIKQIELNYVKKFQKFQDKRIRLNKESTEEIVKAKEEGSLHEALLDRRAKMKADRYCK